MAIGEAGQITTNSPTENQPITVNFSAPIENAVIALTGTNNGGNQHSFRIIDVQENSFTFILEEWEYHDGAHAAFETISYIAIEEGTHTLPDGRVIVAGTASATHNTGSVTFDTPFGGTPVVLTSVMSNNEDTTIDSDPRDITASGFNIRLQEEEAEDRVHVAETVGFIAIDDGGDGSSGTASIFGNFDEQVDTLSLGATYSNPITVADTQTVIGPDTARVVTTGGDASTIDLFLQEEQSQDNELGHTQEQVGIVTFEAGVIPCFTSSCMIETPKGNKRVEDLCAGDMVTTQSGPRRIRYVAARELGPDFLAAHPHLKPIVIRRGALGGGLPYRDMRVSPQHRMLVDGIVCEIMFGHSQALAPALALVNGKTVRIASGARRVLYFHILFDAHEIIRANGCWTESLYPGEQVLAGMETDARDEVLSLFPELRTITGYGAFAAPVLKSHEARAFAARALPQRMREVAAIHAPIASQRTILRPAPCSLPTHLARPHQQNLIQISGR